MTRSTLRGRGTRVLLVTAAGLASIGAPAAVALASGPVPVLTGISATHHRGYDRLVFTFAGGLPARRRVHYINRLAGAATASGITGHPVLLVSFAGAAGLTGRGLPAYGPTDRSYALPGVIRVVTVGLRHRQISLEVELARREPVRIAVLAHHRLAIKVPTPYRTVGVRDYFLNSRNASATVPAERPVIEKGQVSRVLQRLFAGPTQAELNRGLRFVSSGATGVEQVTVRQGVARVYLAGRCASGGSAVTIATEIVPTLRQFSFVHWVKIYDPEGHTQQRAGRSDSIPACLQSSMMSLLTAQLRGPALPALILLTGFGILLGLALTIFSITTGLARRPNLITPRAYQAEQIKLKPVQTGQFAPDLAWPFYPVRQMQADLGRIEAERRARYRKLWKWPFRPVVWILLLPVSASAVICLAIAGMINVLLNGLFALVILICGGITTAAFMTAMLLMRYAESGWRKVMRAEASCPRPDCYHVTFRPAYRCPGCGDLHRNLRPGRLGVFTRRCQCGVLIPASMLRAAWRLTAVCQRCREPMRIGAGIMRDVRIPIFGDVSAGKTRFLYAGLDSLIDATRRARLPLGFPDEESEQQATLGLEVIRSDQYTAKTSLTLPTALTCQVGKGARGTLIHLFDVAGEVYRDAEMQDSLGFLDHGHGLVYVLDPFSIGSVRDQMAGPGATVIRDAHAAAGDPEAAYGEVVSRLRDSGVEADKQRLAVVISKADLLRVGGLDLPGDSGGIAAWLTAMGIHNLVLSAPREFAEVRYFAVASVAAPELRGRNDPGAPLRWLLANRGLRLPAGPDTSGQTGSHPENAGRTSTDRCDTARAAL